MQAVILAAGLGTRMGELTKEIPKPMLPLLGRPLLEWRLATLPAVIDEVFVVVGYLGEQIEGCFAETFAGRHLHYVYQRELNGTGGALTLLKGKISGRVLVTMGDDLYLSTDLKRLLQYERGVLGIETEEAQAFGLLDTDGRGNLAEITERPHDRERGIVNTGAYVLDEKFFEYPLVQITETEYGLPQTLAAMGKDYPVRVVMAEAWQPVGKPEDLPQGEAFIEKYFQTVSVTG